MKNRSAKIILAVVIALALFWFTANFPYGAYLDGLAYRLYASYANDLLLPFGFYLGLCALDGFIPALRPWQRKATLAFFIPFVMEWFQPLWVRGIGMNFSLADQLGLGAVFDPLDFLAYAIGALGAALIERRVLSRWLPFWN